MDTLAATMKVRQKARELGFDQCGFARAEPLVQEAFQLENWLNQNLHGTMSWMENHFEKRIDPTKLVPGCKSIVSVIMSYRFEENEEFDLLDTVPKVAKYARGRDYHNVFKNRLKHLFNYTKELIGDLNGRIFVDSAPVMDKTWAQRAGNGWIGKNGNLLNKIYGSWFLIGEMIVDVPFIYDTPVSDHCGSCTACIDACPTNAIHEPYRVDSNRCISYLTIELKENMDREFEELVGEWVFGCDICQDVCPWNRKSNYGSNDDLKPRLSVLNPNIKWSQISKDEFETIFEGSAVRRASYRQFIHQAKIAETNIRQTENK
jgi:epoxyqueuosine reductase